MHLPHDPPRWPIFVALVLVAALSFAAALMLDESELETPQIGSLVANIRLLATGN